MSQLPAPQNRPPEDDLSLLARAAVQGGIAPKGMSEIQVQATMHYGRELGFTPFHSMMAITWIQGRATLSGKGMRAKILESGQVEDIKEWIEGDGDARTAFCEIKRKGIQTPAKGQFSMADARQAGLAGKDNYQKYPDDMIAWKAAARASERGFADILKGLAIAEDAETWDSFNNGGAKPLVRESRPLPPTKPAAQPAVSGPSDRREIVAPTSAPMPPAPLSHQPEPGGNPALGMGTVTASVPSTAPPALLPGSSLHKPEGSSASPGAGVTFLPDEAPPDLLPSTDGLVPDEWAYNPEESNEEYKERVRQAAKDYDEKAAKIGGGKKAPAFVPPERKGPTDKEIKRRIFKMLTIGTGETETEAIGENSLTRLALDAAAGFDGEKGRVSLRSLHDPRLDKIDPKTGHSKWLMAIYGTVKKEFIANHPGEFENLFGEE